MPLLLFMLLFLNTHQG